MTTYTITSGYDAHALSVNPSANFGASTLLIVGTSATAPTFVYLPLPDIAGQTIASATLAWTAGGAIAAQTVTAALVTSPWAESSVTFNRQPTVGSSAGTAMAAGGSGEQRAMTVTTLVQAAASGQPWYGFRLTAPTFQVLNSFESGLASWVLTIVTQDAPDIPQSLVPNGTTVGLAKPTLTCDFVDNGGLSNDMAAIQVQIDPAKNTTTPAFDTHAVASTLPLLDLSAAAVGTAVISTTNASLNITAATQTFSTADVGATITGTGIPAGTTIATVTNGTTATLSAGHAATATGTPTVTITKTYAGLGSGSTTFWRVRVQDADGNWSGYSDWASFTYRPQPTLTLLTPAAGVLWDPTSDIIASTSANMSAYRVQITDGTDRTKVRFDSGRIPANPGALTTVDVALPQEYDGTRILVDDRNYQLHIRVWDTFLDRQGTPGSPAFVESWSTFHFDDDLTVTPVTTLTADQGGPDPGITLTWTRASAGDFWVVLRDNKVIAKLAPADVISGVSTWSWTDPHPPQWVAHDYHVKAMSVVSGSERQSRPGPTATITPASVGIWLYTDDGQTVAIDAADVSSLSVLDRRDTYKPVNLPYDVDIVSGFEGISGTLSGTAPSGLVAGLTVSDVIDTLLSIKESPSTPVRLVYGTFAGKVLLRNVSVTPSPLASPAVPLVTVSFGVNQVGDFDSVK